MVDNPMPRDARRALTTSEERARRELTVYQTMRADLIFALKSDPAMLVDVPGSARSPWPAYEIIADQFADSKNGNDSLIELLRIVSRCAAGKLDHETHLRASAWIAARANSYAAWYAPDAVAMEIDDEQTRPN
jgi:hypothetical protein